MAMPLQVDPHRWYAPAENYQVADARWQASVSPEDEALAAEEKARRAASASARAPSPCPPDPPQASTPAPPQTPLRAHAGNAGARGLDPST